jgi:hypothetical protein
MEEALTAHLLASPALAALVGSEIHWKLRPQGSPLPAVVLHLISGPGDYTTKARSSLTRNRVQVDCLSEDYLVAVRVSRAVVAAADAIAGQAGFQAAFVEGERDTLTGTNTDTHTDPIVGRSLDLMVWRNPS